jgi:biopolymer transport protein ExbD
MKLPPPTVRRARIEIVPMIDTIFFLLVFFMMSTLSMVKMEGLGLALPKDVGTGKTKAPPRIVVAVSPAGEYLLDGRRQSASGLPESLRSRLKASPTAVVVVNVSPAQKTQTLVSTLDIVDEVLQEAGSSNPVLVATPKIKSDNVEKP